MAKARARSKPAAPRRLPRGRHALTPDEVERDQRERLLAAVPGVVAKHGYEAMSVADIVKAAAVSRNAFYKSFSDKQDCFATAHEAGHERLFDVLATPCEAGATAEERVERALGAALGALAAEPDVARPLFVAAPSEGGVARALGAALGALAAEPDVARLLFVEAPSAGEEIALRYHEWLGRYGTPLRAAAPDRKSVGEGKSGYISVTGVQTCALPICRAPALRRGSLGGGGDRAPLPRVAGPLRHPAARRRSRSEERRGGKEWIYQCDWSSDVCSSDLSRACSSSRLPRRGRRSRSATTSGWAATAPCCAPPLQSCPHSLSLHLRSRV